MPLYGNAFLLYVSALDVSALANFSDASLAKALDIAYFEAFSCRLRAGFRSLGQASVLVSEITGQESSRVCARTGRKTER